MKKLLILIGFLLFAASFASAQAVVNMPLAVGDTLINTGTVTKYVTATGGYSGASITVHCTVQSGTGAGTVVLYGSNDIGANPVYTAIGSSYTITNVANNGITFNVPAPLPYSLKILGTGSGTESTLITVYYRLPYYQIPTH